MSRSVSVLELGREIAQKHDLGGAGRITVIPVIVDDLMSIGPFLRALCELIDGSFLDTSGPELQQAVAGTTNAVLRAAVERAMAREPGIPRHVRLEDVGGGLLDAAFFEPPSSPSPSPGEQVVLAVVRAVAHRDLDTHQFVVITYSENPVDIKFRPRIWRLAVDQLNKMPHETLRTLVLVVENEIDIELHCQTGRGFQLAIEGDRLIRRKGPEDLVMQAGLIAKSSTPIVLFLGAGFAASSHIPLANSMRDQAIRRLLGIPAEEAPAATDIAERFHALVTDQNWLSPLEQWMSRDQFVASLTLEQVVRIEMKIDPSLPTLREFKNHHDSVLHDPGRAVRDLANILERAVGRIVVVEVNFDQLVETHTKVPLRVFASSQDFAAAPEYLRRYVSGDETAIPLLKLHGTITDFETCVISGEQTEPGVGKEKLEALRALLGEENERRRWVYVGASMRDLDLRPVFLHEDFARGIDERWVSPYLPDTVEEFGRERERQGCWRSTDYPTIHDRIITERADEFFAALRRVWA